LAGFAFKPQGVSLTGPIGGSSVAGTIWDAPLDLNPQVGRRDRRRSLNKKKPRARARGFSNPNSEF
jgi:hypothetical protein